jgi:hypothetical protein
VVGRREDVTGGWSTQERGRRGGGYSIKERGSNERLIDTRERKKRRTVDKRERK